MFYTLAQQQYNYSRGFTVAEQRAADVRVGEAVAVLRDLRLSLAQAFRRTRLARKAAPVVTRPVMTEVRPVVSARVLSGAR